MKKLLVLVLNMGLALIAHTQNISEYCFDKEKLEIRIETTTPSEFLKTNQSAVAAINGPYFDLFGKTEGLVVVQNENYSKGATTLACCTGEVRGYLYVGKGASKITADMTVNPKTDISVIIGSHPLLIVGGGIYSQAREDRYNLFSDGSIRTAYRSAIGTKDGVHLCIAVSESEISMEQWANLLLSNGYTQAINLDGGPISQLSVRGKNSHGGGGSTKTRMIICAMK